MRNAPAWRAPAWYAKPAPRLLFQRELAACGLLVQVVRPPRRHRGGFAVAVQLDVPDLPPRTVTVVFGRGAPHVPHVYTDLPLDSPHRYSDGALCMWFPGDPADRRWVLKDGPAALLGHVIVHLLREEWWQRTGEWPGEEAAHLPVAGTGDAGIEAA